VGVILMVGNMFINMITNREGVLLDNYNRLVFK